MNDHVTTLPREDVREGTPAPEPPGDAYGRRQWIGLLAGPVLLVAVAAMEPPGGLGTAGWRTAAVGLLMAVWWMTEAAPIAVTALLPLVLFPLLGIAGIAETAAPYASPLIFLFMGGFLIALAMERWGLHRRLALSIIRRLGARPHALVMGFMAASAFLSMWVSNTATAMMMLPIGLSVVELVHGPDGERQGGHFAVVLMLAIAYSCSIGGVGTLIGTPTNALLAGFMYEAYGHEIAFAGWMLVGVTLMLVGLPLVYGVLTRVVYPIGIREIPGGRRFIEEQVAALGRMNRGERMVAAVFAATAVLWMSRPLLDDHVPGLSDPGIAMAAALLLFLLPVAPKRGVFVLGWSDTRRLPWGVLILFGGGLSLAAAINDTGLAAWIGEATRLLADWPVLALVTAVVAVIILLTELTSNTATAAAFLPIVASVAVGVGQNPLLFVVPTALAASCAFMLPVATPPNAIVYGGGFVTIPQMARAGLVLNVLFAVLVSVLSYLLLPLVLDVSPGVVPEWAAPR